jgi:hypothetical protein
MKSELKRLCTQDPVEMAKQIAEITEKLAAAEAAKAKERQAGRDEVLKELSDRKPDFIAFESCGILSGKSHAHDDRLVNLIIRPSALKE